MEFKKYSDPYPHVIVNNFLPINLINIIEDIFKNEKKYFRPYTHRENRFSIDIRTIPRLMTYIDNIKEDIVNMCRNELEERFNQLVTKDNFILMEHKICLDKVGYSIPKHCDTLKKAITIVVYINELGSTTTLYDNEYKNEKEIDKKKNSALIFVPTKNSTWHEVKPTDHERHTLQIMFTSNF